MVYIFFIFFQNVLTKVQLAVIIILVTITIID